MHRDACKARPDARGQSNRGPWRGPRYCDLCTTLHLHAWANLKQTQVSESTFVQLHVTYEWVSHTHVQLHVTYRWVSHTYATTCHIWMRKSHTNSATTNSRLKINDFYSFKVLCSTALGCRGGEKSPETLWSLQLLDWSDPLRLFLWKEAYFWRPLLRGKKKSWDFMEPPTCWLIHWSDPLHLTDCYSTNRNVAHSTWCWLFCKKRPNTLLI